MGCVYFVLNDGMLNDGNHVPHQSCASLLHLMSKAVVEQVQRSRKIPDREIRSERGCRTDESEWVEVGRPSAINGTVARIAFGLQDVARVTLRRSFATIAWLNRSCCACFGLIMSNRVCQSNCSPSPPALKPSDSVDFPHPTQVEVEQVAQVELLHKRKIGWSLMRSAFLRGEVSEQAVWTDVTNCDRFL
ncbi:hypothetical protein KC354_g117 [Hortaea werneckii]|nr:hypothetical protein KC354_g117 [Hortaea werneckii]